MAWSKNQESNRKFMNLAKQTVRSVPEVPPKDERLRAFSLVAEEAFFELANALGFTLVHVNGEDLSSVAHIHIKQTHEPNLVEIADAIADGHYVLTCLACACGIDEQEVLDEVNANNLSKFGPGHSFREDGKLLKPADYTPPDIAGIIEGQQNPLKIVPRQHMTDAYTFHVFVNRNTPVMVMYAYMKANYTLEEMQLQWPFVTGDHLAAIDSWVASNEATAAAEFTRFNHRPWTQLQRSA